MLVEVASEQPASAARVRLRPPGAVAFEQFGRLIEPELRLVGVVRRAGRPTDGGASDSFMARSLPLPDAGVRKSRLTVCPWDGRALGRALGRVLGRQSQAWPSCSAARPPKRRARGS